MIYDILWSLYIVLLFPFLYECEKMKYDGLKFLLIGVLLTPIIGYIALYVFKKNRSRGSSTLA